MSTSGGRRRGRRLPRVGALHACLALAVLAGGCTPGEVGSGDVLPAAAIPEDDDPGVVHVHGLGVNPADGLLYIATHFGLWRLDGVDVARVGDAYHDLMGFTVAGPDRFLASGHPLLVEDRLPPHLGLISSDDAGQTWRSVSLLGEVDFHALRHAHDRVYGWDSTSATFMVSADGRDWDRRAAVPIIDFAVSPTDPDVVLAGTQDGAGGVQLIRSDDGGREFTPADGPPAARLSWVAPDRLWVVDVGGTVWRSSDGGGSWTEVGRLDGPPEAFLDTGEELYAAEHGAILVSADGAAWEVAHEGDGPAR
jgi:hypothetical protein